ncbi:hypothetical protein EFP20_14460 [Burkholderia glumae]|nr:hypothetical protein NCPPB3923_13960 [Burkholderia glumae]PNL05063.1 hypothetical protein CEQ24_003775 [Burkholderia glumae]UVS92170.1 hypothetical protein EFP17_20555 [Burkholderia glumae]UVT02721.1 hypothetical protein EFP20_14460 [Burkholderia glumae]
MPASRGKTDGAPAAAGVREAPAPPREAREIETALGPAGTCRPQPAVPAGRVISMAWIEIAN